LLRCVTLNINQSIIEFVLFQATALYKLVAERGPWSSLSRWALESYLKGDVGKAFLLYARMAELGYDVACVWENLSFVQMQKGISVHILCGGRLLSRVTNMPLCLLAMHITMVGYVSQDEIGLWMLKVQDFDLRHVLGSPTS